MTKRRDPYRRSILAPRLTPQCSRCRKVNHSTKEKADTAAAKVGGSSYLCPAGNGWHVTTRKKAA